MEEQNKNWQPSDDMMMELQLAINNANDTAKCVKLIDVTKKPKLKRHLNEFAEDENVQLIYCSTESETTEIKKAIDDITEQICKPSHILLFAKEKFDKVCHKYIYTYYLGYLLLTFFVLLGYKRHQDDHRDRKRSKPICRRNEAVLGVKLLTKSCSII